MFYLWRMSSSWQIHQSLKFSGAYRFSSICTPEILPSNREDIFWGRLLVKSKTFPPLINFKAWKGKSYDLELVTVKYWPKCMGLHCIKYLFKSPIKKLETCTENIIKASHRVSWKKNKMNFLFWNVFRFRIDTLRPYHGSKWIPGWPNRSFLLLYSLRMK